MDTGVPLTNPRHVPARRTSASPIRFPADLRGGVGFQNTPRVQINKFDHTKRGYVNFDYIKPINFARRSTTSRAASACQHTSNDVDLSYPAGGYVTVWWDRSFESNATGHHRSRALRLLRGGRHRHARQGQLEHPVALRAGPVDAEQPADAEPRASAPSTRRSRRSGRTSRTSPSSSASATSCRPASARATTGSATAG